MLLPRTLIAATVAAALLTSACAGDAPDTEEPQPPPTPVERVWPLTGLPGMAPDDAAQIITVKVDNTPSGRPRLGIDSAELVVEELVEGGVTRLAAMYHLSYPEQVGAVRSMRATDAGVVLPTGGTLASSGGERSTRRGLRALDVPLAVEEEDPGFTRATDRAIPYNLMLDVRELGDSLPPVPAPEPYLPFGDLPADVAAKPADTITLSWPGASSRFGYDPASELWTLEGATDSAGLGFTNVLAVFVPVVFNGGFDAAGTPIPTLQTEGTGRAVLATGGGVTEAQWQKPSPSQRWTFTYDPVSSPSASAGTEPSASAPAAPPPAPLTIPPGRTWIGLIPTDGGAVDTTKPNRNQQ